MNKLRIAFGVLGAAAVICVTGHFIEHQLRSGSVALTSRLLDAETGLAQSRAGLDSVRAQLASLEQELGHAREGLEQAQSDARTAKPPELDPVREGAWPATEPYFYLAKRRLKDIGFGLF